MPRINFRLDGFQPAPPPQLLLVCEWVDLLWSAITVGRREWHHVVMHGIYSRYEIAYRACLLFANLAEAPSDHITRSGAYNALDPSEKGAVSYFLGLTLAKLFCDHVLHAPWMMHLAVYFNQLQPMIFNSTRRPDLVGQDLLGRWLIAESKGRTNDFDPGALATAKLQTQAIARIAGQLPHLRFALVSHFSSPNEFLAANCSDPADTGEGSSDLLIERDQFLTDYYQPFVDFLPERSISPDAGDVSVTIPELDITVGMQRDVHQLVRRRQYRELSLLVSEFSVPETSIRRKTGTDGIIVELGATWFNTDGSIKLPAKTIVKG